MDEIVLKDIHLPDPGLWWPPAPGWWLLLLMLILSLISLPKLIRWWRQKPIKRSSLRELRAIRHMLESGGDEQAALQKVSVLMRRTAMSYSSRNRSARLNGEEWVRELERLAGENSFSEQQCDWLSRGQYQQSVRCDAGSMIDSCENWIRALPRRYNDAAV